MNLGGRDIRRAAKGLSIESPAVPGDGSDPDVYKPLKDALMKFFRPAVNVTAERYRFRNRRQEETESVTSYITALRDMARQCGFTDTSVDTVENNLIRDQLIAGLRSRSNTL